MNALLKNSFSANITEAFKWMLFSLITGTVIGLVGTFFMYCLNTVIDYRDSHRLIIALSPIAGILIVAFYKAMDSENDKGTNTVIASVSSGNSVPVKMAPLIFLATVITHMYGGSAGREGAALQIGGSLGSYIGELLKINKNGKKIFVMSGMSAAFSALFGTPVTASIFAMEVASVGNMQYGSFVPCVISALIANKIAVYFGYSAENYTVTAYPEISFIVLLKVVVFGFLCAGISTVFVLALHKIGALFKAVENQYLRIIIGGCIIVVLFVIFGRDYSSTGIAVIERAVEGEVVPYAFILKILLTAITLGCGFKGGEIVPSLFIGATFGCLVGQFLNISPSFLATVGMVSIFCGVTNCPLASLFMAVELFGSKNIVLYLLCIAVTYNLSGYYSLYKTQRFIYSKHGTDIIYKNAK